MDIEKTRKKIDGIDKEIVELLKKRADAAVDIAESKNKENLPVPDPAREKQIMDNITSASKGRFPKDSVKQIFREIISATRQLENSLRTAHTKDTVIDVKGVKIGGMELCIIAGPCAVESEEQILAIAKELSKLGVKILRGGAFKPRSSPYTFQGLGEEGLKYLAKAKEETGMLIVTEVMESGDVALVTKYADILQIGARNMQNFKLLKVAAKTAKPILLKRGMSSDLEDFLVCADYIISEGNPNVILCERGIKTFTTYTRNTLDLNLVPTLKQKTHLPVLVDPSHGTGDRDLVTPMAKAGVACGADGLMIEVHTNPKESVSDAAQSITPQQFAQLLKEVASVAKAVGRIV